MSIGAGKFGTVGGRVLDGSTQALAAPSAYHILSVNRSASSGTYWLYDSQGTKFEAYCDMTTAGGGWQHFAVSHSGTTAFNNFNTTTSWYDTTNTRPIDYSYGTYDKTGSIPTTSAGTYWRNIKFDLKGNGNEGSATQILFATNSGDYMTASLNKIVLGNNSAVTDDSNFSTSISGATGYYMMFRSAAQTEDPWINVSTDATPSHGSDTSSGEYMFHGDSYQNTVHTAWKSSRGGVRLFVK